jgi:DNA processing protein
METLPRPSAGSGPTGVFERPISPIYEMGAYEALWLMRGATFKTLAEKFHAHPDALPSDFVSPEDIRSTQQQVLQAFAERAVTHFGIRLFRTGDYPPRLRNAKHPVELLYFQGTWELAETKCVAVIGTRKPSDDGVRRATKIAAHLVARKFTVVSGLAAGIDTAAHQAAIAEGGRTIAVIGTPLGHYYPPENRELQNRIAREHLLISQVPVLRYSRQGVPQNRLFFPERNKTMSALTAASVIVEAGETSGTLIQARAALQQGRKLFILQSCFDRPDLQWPAMYEKKGAIRIREPEDMWQHLD